MAIPVAKAKPYHDTPKTDICAIKNTTRKIEIPPLLLRFCVTPLSVVNYAAVAATAAGGQR
jgi:hypothetical protein